MNIIHGDCLEELKKLEDNSVDAIVTDPPYGLSNTKPQQVADVLKAWVTGDTVSVPTKRGGFMGADWDSFVPPPAVWEECMRVLKPGGHMAVFAGSRTQDLMGLSIRLAGFEIRDTLGWVYGSGFPKSHNIGKAIDKAAGAEREKVAATGGLTNYAVMNDDGWSKIGQANPVMDGPTPATPEAAKWDGWGTALKPAIEPIILARKPLDGTVANNVLAHGVGGLNIDACRVKGEPIEIHARTSNITGANSMSGTSTGSTGTGEFRTDGRFPANVLLDEHAAKEMDKQSGVSVSRAGGMSGDRKSGQIANEGGPRGLAERGGHDDSGGASRFFPVFKYQAKAPKKERPVIVREDGSKIQHPTVKPLKLMEWLVTLITPEGGTILDPFAGTGTTLQAATNKGFRPIGIEADTDYIQLIHRRMEGGTTSTRSS